MTLHKVFSFMFQILLKPSSERVESTDLFYFIQIELRNFFPQNVTPLTFYVLVVSVK